MDLKEKRITVTGGAGFLGSQIVKLLEEKGCDIVVPRRRFYDLRTEEAVDRLFRYHPADIVIHAAAHAGGIGLNQAKPGELFYDNALMGIQLMEAARKAGVKKFVQLGTICEYPKFAITPFSELDLWNGYPENTNAPYGIAKKALLVMGQSYRQQYNFNVIHLLPVNLYGPGDNFKPESSHVIPALIQKFINAKIDSLPEVTVWGNGGASREFLYVEDCAEAIVKATELYDEGEPVNIGTGSEITIKALAEMIAELVDYGGKIVYDSSKPNGQPRRCLDVSKAKEKFDFEARTKFKLGLSKTIMWYLKGQINEHSMRKGNASL
jgi:GDP-L-fucose synthase